LRGGNKPASEGDAATNSPRVSSKRKKKKGFDCAATGNGQTHKRGRPPVGEKGASPNVQKKGETLEGVKETSQRPDLSEKGNNFKKSTHGVRKSNGNSTRGGKGKDDSFLERPPGGKRK